MINVVLAMFAISMGKSQLESVPSDVESNKNTSTASTDERFRKRGLERSTLGAGTSVDYLEIEDLVGSAESLLHVLNLLLLYCVPILILLPSEHASEKPTYKQPEFLAFKEKVNAQSFASSSGSGARDCAIGECCSRPPACCI